MAAVTHVLAECPGCSLSMTYDDVTLVLQSFTVVNTTGGPATLRVFHPVLGETLVSVPDTTNRTLAAPAGIVLETHTTKGGIVTVGLPAGVEVGWRLG